MNECTIMGRVVGDPQFVPAGGDNEYAFVNVLTIVREPDANGQFTDHEIVVPLLVTEPSKVRVMKDYVQDGRQIKVDTHYKAWENDGQEGHAFIVNRIVLGDKPYVPKDEEAKTASPQLPPV
jgi:uncharacterized protein (UPF0297 family)